MNRICKPAVAGAFYPADPQELRQQLSGFLSQAPKPKGPPPKALIAPHAGYIYSGPVAASAYAQIIPLRTQITRVVVLAPAHRLPFSGIARSSANRFATPLGEIPVDEAALDEIADLPQVSLIDGAFAQEHSIEVHLPFLQTCLEHFSLVPLLVGDSSPQEVYEILERLWGGDETLIVVSSDLSHYLDYDQARQTDAQASSAIMALDPLGLSHQHACGRIPVGGLLLAARHHKLTPETLDLRNSGDTAGPRDRVVGYGAYSFHA